jgi:hypothetical protein
VPTKARIALDENLEDVERLLDLHKEKGGSAPGRRYGLEVLNKAAIVLITSYWESYCEDLAEEALGHIVTHAPNSDSLPLDIRKLVAKELKADQNEIAIWEIADDKWRKVLRSRLTKLKETRNRRLNTPKTSNIDELFEEAIGLKRVSSSWRWAKKLTVDRARARLDQFVSLRGEIAHRGKASTAVKKSQVVKYLNIVRNATAKTGEAVSAHVHSVTNVRFDL